MVKNINIKELTDYKKFSVLKSLDAIEERIKIFKKILKINNNKDFLNQIKTNPDLLIKNIDSLFLKIGPRSIGLNPTPKCNRKCVFCSSKQRNLINIKNKIEINKEHLMRLLSDFSHKGGRGCVLVGGGESALACDGEVFNILKRSDLKYGCNTNGICLMKFLSPKLLPKMTWISISIIAHNSRLYNLVAGLNDKSKQFSVLEKNLKQCIALQKSYKNKKFPHISAKILICRENYQNTGKIYNYIKSLGFADVALRCVNNFEVSHYYKGVKLMPQDIELNNKQRKILHKILTIETNLNDREINNIVNSQLIKTKHKPSICWIIVLGLIANVDTDGKVYLCNPRLGLNNYNIGNINQNNFTAIWQSEKHIKIIRKTYHSFVKKCDLSKCRHFRVNQLTELYLEGKIKSSKISVMDKMMSNFP